MEDVMMKSDRDIQKDLDAELCSGEIIDADDFHVKVKDQVVVLSGVVSSYAQKKLAERVAHRLAEGCVISNFIEVRNDGVNGRSLNGTRRHPDKTIRKSSAEDFNRKPPKKMTRSNVRKYIESPFEEKIEGLGVLKIYQKR
jgi:hypothetical protein